MKKNSYLNTMLSIAGLLISIVIGSKAFAEQAEQAYTMSYRYSPGGLLTGTISPDPDGSGSLRLLATRNTYVNGLLTTVEKGELATWVNENILPSAWSGFTVYSREATDYDNYGRKSAVTVYDKNNSKISVKEFSYDSRSRVLCAAIRMDLIAKGDACVSSNLSGINPDRITRFTYDEFDQVSTEERAVGTSIQQNYVTNVYEGRNLRFQVDANCNKTELRYNSRWLLEKIVYPASARALAAGQACDKPANPNSLPIKAGNVNASDYLEYRYDANGNKSYERKRNGSSITYTIDNNDRVTFKDYSSTSMQDISYNYDLRGLQLSAKYGSDSGNGITNVFDGFGSLSNATNTMGSVTRTLSYGYDLNGNRSYVKHPDNQYFSYTFDQLNRIKGISDSNAANDNLLSVTYQPIGRRDKIIRTGGSETTYFYPNGVRMESFSQSFTTATNNLTNSFLYNAAGQVTSLTQSNSQYNYVGNNDRVGTYTPNGLNQYTHIANQPMGHDLNGNMTNDGFSTYTFDDENRLLTASGSGLSASLIYDPNGRLFQTTINGTTRQYLYDGDALVAEYVNGAVQRRYVHGDQVDEPLVQYNGASVAVSSRRYLHANHQGSIIAHSNSSGSVVNTLAYDAYGIPASMNVDTFAYTGQIWLKDLNLYYYKARIYSPRIGRFLQTDPIGYKDQMNMYAYVGNDPVNYVDPFGEQKYRGDKSGSAMTFIVATIVAANSDPGSATHRWALRVAESTNPGNVGSRRSSSSQRQFKEQVWAQNAEKNNGTNRCEKCDKEVEKGKKLEKGETISENRGDADHKQRLADGGANDAKTNGQLLCNPCHVEKTTAENMKPPEMPEVPDPDKLKNQ